MKFEIQSNEVRDLEEFDDVDDGQVSVCESVVTNDDECTYEGLFSDNADLVRLNDDDLFHNAICNKFLSCLRGFVTDIDVIAVHKKAWSNIRGGDLKLRCFEIYRQQLKNKFGDDSKMKYAWYGSSKENIARITSRGFGLKDVPIYNGGLGDGILFSPVNSLNQSVSSINSCVIDDDGLMHIMLCRILLESEGVVTNSGSSASTLSSDNSTSVVGDKKDVGVRGVYLVRGEDMKTHILPEYVISFKAPCLKGISPSKGRILSKKPNSPWLHFSTLITMLLPELLHPKRVDLIKKQHRAFKERKISRAQLIQMLKRLVGVDVLVAMVKLYGA